MAAFRLRRFLLAAALGVAALALILVAGGAWLLRTDDGRAMLAGWVVEAASVPGEMEVAVGRLDGALPGELVLRDVALADRDGVWLTVRTARLKWRPWSLVSRRLDIEALMVDGLDVVRAPVAEAPAESEALPDEISLPRLPLDIRLASFDFTDVTLGEALAGEAVALRASGRFGADRAGDARGTVKVERTDGVALTASLDAVLEAATQTLDIDLRVGEPAGGMIARLAGLPDLPAVSLTLKGRGPASAWQGALTAEATDLAALNGDMTLALGERPTLGLAGAADISGLRRAGLVDDDLLALTGPVPQFDIAVALEADGDRIAVEHARLTGAAVEATLAGIVETASLDAGLRATATLTDPAIIGRFAEGVAVGGASATVRLNGPVDALRYAATLDADDVAGGGVTAQRLAVTSDGTIGSTRITGAHAVRLEGLAGSDPAFAALPPQLVLTAETALDLAAQRVDVSQFALTGEGVQVDGRGGADLAGGDITLDATAALARLKPFAAIAGIDLDGRAEVSAALTGRGFGERAAGSVTLRLTELASTELPLAPAVGRAATLKVTLDDVSTDGASVPEFSLSSANLSLTGRAAIGGGWQTLDVNATLGDHRLADWSDFTGTALAGSLRGTAKITGTLADPKADVALTLKDVAAEGVGPVAGSIAVSASGLAAAPGGTLSAKLTGPAGPVSAGLRFALTTPEQLTLGNIAFEAAGARIGGDAKIDLARSLADGRLDIAADDLAPLGALAGVPVSGALTGRLDLSAGDDQRATLTMRSPSVSVSPPGGMAVTAKTLDLRAELTGLAPQPAGRVTLSVASIEGEGLALTVVKFTGEGTAERVTYTASAKGAKPVAFDLSLAGDAAPAGAGWTVGLDRLDGTLAGAPLALQAPARLTLSDDALALSPLDLTIAGGRVTADVALDRQNAKADLDVRDLSLAVLGSLAEGSPKLGGTASLRVSLSGAAANPSATATLTVADVKASDIDAASNVALDGEVSATLRDTRLDVNGEIGGFAERGLTIDASLPLGLTAWPFEANLPPDGAVDGSVAWNGEVATLWEALPFSTHRLSGIADISVKAGGTVAEPVATGRVGLSGGRFESLEMGTVFDKLQIDATVDEGRNLTISLDATDAGTGTLSGKGEVALDPLKAFPTAVELTFREATLVRRDEITLAANGDLSLQGDAREMDLTGRIETTRIEARIDSSLPPSVVELDVIDANAPKEETDEKKESSRLALDLDIVVPGQAFVRGRGLDSEWRGDLRVSGDAATPLIAGTMSFVRGFFSFAGKRFTLDDSTITFDGTEKIDPLLDIRAAHEASDITALILITGRASNPSIALSSTPPLPQDEVLSRVLFGKNAGSLSPVEGLQLAAAIAQLSGKGPAGAGILDKVRDALGVDVLEVGGNGNGASLRAGRYIDEKTFVGVTQGTEPGSTGVTVEYEVLPNILVDTQIDETGNNKSGVKWKWDY